MVLPSGALDPIAKKCWLERLCSSTLDEKVTCTCLDVDGRKCGLVWVSWRLLTQMMSTWILLSWMAVSLAFGARTHVTLTPCSRRIMCEFMFCSLLLLWLSALCCGPSSWFVDLFIREEVLCFGLFVQLSSLLFPFVCQLFLPRAPERPSSCSPVPRYSFVPWLDWLRSLLSLFLSLPL